MNKLKVIITFFLFCIIISCDKFDLVRTNPHDPKSIDYIISFPKLTTALPTNVSINSAKMGGEVISDGGASVTERGVCWCNTTKPTITNSKTIDGTGVGIFESSLIGLTTNTKYYVRAYATNSIGTAYGNEIVLKTYTGTVTDVEGNIYNTVTIDNQLWMVENLKTTKYSDGTEIPLVTDIIVWGNLTSPAYSLYGYIPDVPNIYKATYGALYNWYVVDSASSSGKNVCPAGWHVPNDVEWATLVTYLGGESIAGGKLKEAGTNHWTSPNTGATNESGFTALPGGGYYYYGSLYFTVSSGRWWSATSYHATEAKSFIMSYNTIVAYNRSFQKQSDFHIRCLKN